MSISRRQQSSGSCTTSSSVDEGDDPITTQHLVDEAQQLSEYEGDDEFLTLVSAFEAFEGDIPPIYPKPKLDRCAADSGPKTPLKSNLGKRKERSIPIEPSKLIKRQRLTVPPTPNVDPNVPYIIAHDPEVERIMDELKIRQGVRFEIARLVSLDRIAYPNIKFETLSQLNGSNQDCAPAVVKHLLNTEIIDMSPYAAEVAAKLPWEELDIEEETLEVNPYGGLGNNADRPGWYGGKVEFRGKLKKIGEKSYTIELDRCTLGPSCRFTRRFGSWSFAHIKIPDNVFHNKNNNLDRFFKKPFILWGHVYRSCYAKEGSVFLFKTNDVHPPSSPILPASHGLSLESFIRWHNPIQENGKQFMSKWAARMALGFSNSVPGPVIQQQDIYAEDEIVSSTGSEMTDGCGFSSKSLHLWIRNHLSLEMIPTAIQFRLAGNKGMSMIKDDGICINDGMLDDKLQFWVRPSQTKIRYPSRQKLDPAMLTLDVLRTSYTRTPAAISTEVIVNLAENGVPHSVFIELMKQSIREIVAGLTTWEGPDAMYNLWLKVERTEGVLTARRAREAVGEARFRGYSNKTPDDELDADEADEDGMGHYDSAVMARSTAWWPDPISGSPSSLAETVMYLLDSGFTPQTCPILREKLKNVVNKKIVYRTQSLKFDIQYSVSAFVVCDRFGVLGPDEIQYKCSSRRLKSVDGFDTDIVLGEVLMTRSPCKLPTDVRKVRAVEHPRLRNLVDVIVCSVQGHRRLLDFLAGGDYDGDTCMIIYAPEIVSPFINADEKYSIEPQGLDLGFTREQETGIQFLQRTANMTVNQRCMEIQTFLLGALRDTSQVGRYSSMLDYSVYFYGYSNPRSIKLAYKFCRVLDSPKTGWKIKPSTFASDQRDYASDLGPAWKAIEKEKKKTGQPRMDQSNRTYTKRSNTRTSFIKGRFIMDVLMEAAMQEREHLLAETNVLFAPLSNCIDLDLTKPWDQAVERAERDKSVLSKALKKDLSFIAAHVQNMYKSHKAKFKGKGGPSGSSGSFTDRTIEDRQDIMRDISKEFSESPTREELDTFLEDGAIARLRASYAYKYDTEQPTSDPNHVGSRFPWNCAMRELCAIKSAAIGPHKTVTNAFYEKFRLTKPR